MTVVAVVAAAIAAADVSLPAAPAVVEFFAPWCPVCQRFAPHWAALEATVQPPVEVASVDCDQYDCGAWGVRAYPTVVMFPAGGGVDVYTGPFTAEYVATWLVRDHGVSIGAPVDDDLDGSGSVDEPTPSTAPARVAAGVAVPADAFAGFDALVPSEIVSAADYVAATTVAGALAALPGGHERYECVRLSIAAGRSPRGCADAPVAAGNGVCRGAFPCVVWAMLHVLVASAPTDAVAVERLSVGAVAVIRWFPCTECVVHFQSMVAGKSGMFPLASVKSRRGAVLWLWSAHNAVNMRRGVGVFPFPGMCDECSSEEDVFQFLDSVYAPAPPLEASDDYSRSGTVGATVIVLGIVVATVVAVARTCRNESGEGHHETTASLLEDAGEPDEAPPLISGGRGDPEPEQDA